MRYLLRRAAHLVAVLFAVSFITFISMNLLGDPLKSILGPLYADKQVREEARAELHLEGSVPERYVEWVADAVQGDFGRSYNTRETVSAVIGERLPVSLMLMVYAQVLALLIAVPVAVAAAYRADRAFDRMSTAASFVFISVPGFASAVIFLYAFAVRNDLFPARYLDDSFFDRLYSMFLPALALALPLGAVYMRVLRNDMVNTLQEDFVMFARSKGISTFRILTRHALRPSSISLMTVVGIQIGALLAGALVVETIFSIPGLGMQIVRSILQNDYVVIQAVVLVLAVTYVVVNFFVDALHGVLDPRIRAARAL
ncbi:MAG: ABC transporter permease [Actinobacteria bacterium]|nr:ABC transporter permease [Actinomycetota bacterium]